MIRYCMIELKNTDEKFLEYTDRLVLVRFNLEMKGNTFSVSQIVCEIVIHRNVLQL